MAKRVRNGAALALLLAVLACTQAPQTATVVPPARPAGLVPAAPPPRSERSAELARYYVTVQNDLLARGLLRTDGGGPDTPYSSDMLAANFERIAFFDEYSRGTGLRAAGGSGRLSRWSGPVRIKAEFGASVPPEQRARDTADITAYAARLGRVTGHDIGMSQSNPNFHVFITGEDDTARLQKRLVELLPSISAEELDLFGNLPRSYYCLVVAVSGSHSPYDYTRAVALVRAEHPDLMRLSCIHEELAQGLGLPNDSPAARPSIFNDDDEFALLTSQDELLLRMLYDPRMKQGMTADEARPTARIIARELTGQAL